MEKRKTKNYIDGDLLLEQTIESQNKGICTDKLALMLFDICNHILLHNNFRNYPLALKEDMRSFGLEKLMKAWPKVKIEGTQNIDKARCFNYYTRSVFNAYLTVLGKHYRQENIKRELTRRYAAELQRFSPKMSKKIEDNLLDI